MNEMTELRGKNAELSERQARLEGVIEQISARLTNLEAGQREITTTLRWVIGIQFTTLLSLGALILFKLGSG